MFILILLCVLAVAVVYDLRERRIPNWLILAGLPAGIITSWFGGGVEATLSAVAAAGAGMAIFIPFFAARLIGAGDVKLIGVVGAFVGLHGIFPILLYTMMAGGILGLIAVVASRTTEKFFGNLKLFFVASVMRVQNDVIPLSTLANASAVRIPYAVAIAAGVIIWKLGIS